MSEKRSIEGARREVRLKKKLIPQSPSPFGRGAAGSRGEVSPLAVSHKKSPRHNSAPGAFVSQYSADLFLTFNSFGYARIGYELFGDIRIGCRVGILEGQFQTVIFNRIRHSDFLKLSGLVFEGQADR